MFGDLASLADLKPEDRERLASLLADRNEYLRQSIVLNDLRIVQLNNPTPENEARVAAFNSTVVAPLRSKMSADLSALLSSAVNIASIKAFMPMIVAGVMQSVNIPLALTTLGIDPDTVEELVGIVKDYIKAD